MSTVSAPATARNATSLPWSAAPSTLIVTESKTFRSGEATLSGTLYLPDGRQALGAVVGTHSASKPLRAELLYPSLSEQHPTLAIAARKHERPASGQTGGT